MLAGNPAGIFFDQKSLKSILNLTFQGFFCVNLRGNGVAQQSITELYKLDAEEDVSIPLRGNGVAQPCHFLPPFYHRLPPFFYPLPRFTYIVSLNFAFVNSFLKNK